MSKRDDKRFARLGKATSAMEKSIGTPAWQKAQAKQARIQRRAEAQARRLKAKAERQQRRAEAARRRAERR